MRKINAELISVSVHKLCLDINYKLPKNVLDKITKAKKLENKKARKQLDFILENCSVAGNKKLPICQDTGLVEVFMRIGQDVFIDFSKSKFKDLNSLINDAVRTSYKEGYFRKSVLTPLSRENNNKNIPAVIFTEFTKGNKVELYVTAKGFGSENMNALKMFNPTSGIDDIVDFVVDQVSNAGSKPCPPIFLGIGIGGTTEAATLVSKKALLGIKYKSSPKEEKIINNMKIKLISKINKLNIGPFGLGGKITVLDVSINTIPTHIAGLPVSVSFCCWCNRYKKVVI